MTAADRRGLFVPLMAGLLATAWLALWLWEQSPYGRYLDHGQWTQIGPVSAICRAIPGGDIVVPALLYVGGWLLMSTAMMLPTTLPLLSLFRRLTADRRDRARLMSLVIVGYLAVWGGFGAVAHGVDEVLHRIVGATPWLAFNGWAIGAGVLALAGAFQFSALKYRCLDECRTPMSFVIAHWRGRAHAAQAFRLGLDHGLFCLGCCWALMLLMFVVGTGNVGWMLVLGAVMAIEKNLAAGRALSQALGVGLLVWAGLIVVDHV